MIDLIKLEPVWHRDELFIAIKGRLNDEAFSIINNWKGRRYSATHKCYLILYESHALERICSALSSYAQVETTGWGKGATLPQHFTKGWIALPELYGQTLRAMRYAIIAHPISQATQQ